MVRHALYPPLMCAAAANGDTDALIMLHEQVPACMHGGGGGGGGGRRVGGYIVDDTVV